MKKAINILIILSLIISMGVIMSSCRRDVELSTSWEVPDYIGEGEVVEGLNALEIFDLALENYYEAEYMVFVRSMDFRAPLISTTQQTIDITKCYGDEVFTKAPSRFGIRQAMTLRDFIMTALTPMN